MLFIDYLTGQTEADRADWWRRVAHTVSSTVSSATAPIVAAGTAAVTTAGIWWRPITAATLTDETKWKRRPKTYGPFIHNNPLELFNRFEDENWRKNITADQVFCALHHPGIALDLILLYDIKTKHDEEVLRAYGDWTGASRDRLFDTLCRAIQRADRPAQNTTYEDFIATSIALKPNTLLYKALHEHRYWLSPPAAIGKPDTLTRLNEYMRERKIKRIHNTPG